MAIITDFGGGSAKASMTYWCIIWSSEIPARFKRGRGGREREGGGCGAAPSLVFMTQLQIAALKQAIISLPPHFSHTVAL